MLHVDRSKPNYVHCGWSASDDPDAGDPVLAELDAIKDVLTGITSRLDTIERWLADGGG